jgi:hypothetical protein
MLFKQVWINCRTYNGEKHPVTNAANVLSEAFEKAWGQANIEHKWQVEVKREEREEQVGRVNDGFSRGEGVRRAAAGD